MQAAGGGNGGYNQTINISSPKPLSPYEIARQTFHIIQILKKRVRAYKGNDNIPDNPFFPYVYIFHFVINLFRVPIFQVCKIPGDLVKEIDNDTGADNIGIMAVVRADGPVNNPAIYHSETGEYTKLEIEMASGQIIIITTGQNKKKTWLLEDVSQSEIPGPYKGCVIFNNPLQPHFPVINPNFHVTPPNITVCKRWKRSCSLFLCPPCM